MLLFNFVLNYKHPLTLKLLVFSTYISWEVFANFAKEISLISLKKMKVSFINILTCVFDIVTSVTWTFIRIVLTLVESSLQMYIRTPLRNITCLRIISLLQTNPYATYFTSVLFFKSVHIAIQCNIELFILYNYKEERFLWKFKIQNSLLYLI